MASSKTERDKSYSRIRSHALGDKCESKGGGVLLLHVLFVIWRFKSPTRFTSMGGAEKQLLKLVNALTDDSKHSVTILTRKESGDPHKEALSSNVRVYRIPATTIPGFGVFVFSMILPFLILVLNVRKRFDIIHLPAPDLFIFAVYGIGKLLGIPVIVRIAADDFLIPAYSHSLGRWIKIILRSAILKMDAIHVLTPWACRCAQKLGGTTVRVYLIPNGVETPKLQRDYQRLTKRITYIGAMRFFPRKQKTEQKNLKFLIDSFKALLNHINDAKLVMVGDGNYRRHLERYAADLGLSEQVHFVGYQTEIDRFLLETDVFVNPSHHEGMPNTVIEAMACGVYVLCSDIRAHRFLIGNNEYGGLFDQTSEEDFGRRIIAFYAEPSKYARIAAKSRELVRHEFSIKRNMERIITMYHDVIHTLRLTITNTNRHVDQRKRKTCLKRGGPQRGVRSSMS